MSYWLVAAFAFALGWALHSALHRDPEFYVIRHSEKEIDK